MRSYDTLERLLQMEGEARDLAQRLNRTENPDARYEGRDPAGAVRLTVDSTCTVREVAVDRAWQEKVATEALGAAVQQAVADATVARFTAWAETVAENAPPAPGTLPAGVAGRLAHRLAGPSASDPERAAAELEHQLTQREEHAARTFTGHSPARHAAVVVTGAGGLVGVEYREQWLAEARSTTIERETYQAFEAAYKLAGHCRAEAGYGRESH